MQAQKILNKLSGTVVSDKAILIESIQEYGRKEKDYDEVKLLGDKLYSILRANGLNAPAEIDKAKLLEKADTYLYGDRVQDALAILLVLESQEKWLFTQDKMPVYYFNNEIEAARFAQLEPNKKFIWVPSIKNQIITMIALCQINLKDYKAAEKTLKFYKYINPTTFSLFSLQAMLYKNRNQQKFEETVRDSFNYAFNQNQFAISYKNLAYYYEKLGDFESAYSLITMAYHFSENIEIEKEFKRYSIMASATKIDLKKLQQKEVSEKIISLGYPVFITDAMFDAVIMGYEDYLNNYPTLEGKDFYRALLEHLTGSEDLAYEIEDSVAGITADDSKNNKKNSVKKNVKTDVKTQSKKGIKKDVKGSKK